MLFLRHASKDIVEPPRTSTAMTPMRRKSCASCARAKRRCDLGLPSCQRCVEKRSACVYPWATMLEPLVDGVTIAEASTSTAVSSGAQFSYDNFLDAELLDVPLDPITDMAHVTEQSTNRLEDMTDCLAPVPSLPKLLTPGMLALLDGSISSNQLSPSSLVASIATPTSARMPFTLLITHDTPWDMGTINSGIRYQSRCEYVGRRFAQQARELAQCGWTSFIHNSHIQDCPVLQDALSCSALCAMHNSSNDAIVRSLISQRSALLIHVVDTILEHSPSTEIDLLPPIQALLIYQCIGLFAIHNTRGRARAERDEARLKAWIQILRRQLRPLRNGIEWTEWVREESARRTALFAELLISVNAFLSEGFDRGHVRVAQLQYTAQAALWHAASAAEWTWAWNALPRREVRLARMEDDMESIQVDDAEEMTVMIKSLVHGLEQLEGWLGGQPTLLRRWGLREAGPR